MDLSSLDDTFEGVTLGEGITEDDLDDFAVQRQNQYLAELGLTRDDVDPAIFKDNISFATFYQEGLTDKNQKARQDFSDLFESDKAAFSEAYDNAGSNERLNFVYDQYKAGNIEKDEYITLAGQILQDTTDENFKPDTTYFENQGKLYEISNNFLDADNPLFFAREVVLFDDQELNPNKTNYLAEDSENFRRSLGFTNDKSADTRSYWVKARDGVILPLARTALSMATGGQSEQLYSALKLASGETLHGSDWANLAVGGLEQAGIIGPEVTTIDPDTGLEVVTGGEGLFGLDYDTTVGVIQGIGDKDPVKVVTSVVDDNVITKTLEGVGIPSDLANDPDFISGVKEGLTTVVGGGSLKEGLEDGLVEYITEGGGFGGLPDVDIDVDLSGIEQALKPIADTLETVGDVVQSATEPFVDLVDEGIDIFGEEVVDPALQAAEEFVESIPTPDMPEYLGEFPEFPDLPLPDIKLGVNVQMPQLSATRTTDGLFSEELFKFKTKIGLTPTGPLLKPQERKAGQTPEQRQQRKEEVVDLFGRDPFASPLDRNIV